MDNTIIFPTPLDMGLPEKFAGGWRLNQPEAILKIADCQKHVVMAILPTGAGKSPIYVASTVLLGGRSIILTSTKGLMTQLMNDFEPMGMVEVKGRNSYRCAEAPNLSCEEGPCVMGYKCPYRGGGCDYYDQVREAQRASLVVTNYAYWLTSSHLGGMTNSLGSFDNLICDEAHDAPEHVASFLKFEFSRIDDEIEEFLPSSPMGMTIDQWQVWALDMTEILADRIASNADYENRSNDQTLKRHARLKRFKSSVDRLKDLQTSNWIVQPSLYEISFAPIWVPDYCQQYLFTNCKKVILTSASVCQKTAEMMGLKDSDVDLFEFDHTFPVENRLLIHIPTVRMNHRTSDIGMRTWMTRIDQILRGRLDRKGIIHTVSYDRCKMVMEKSEFKRHMLTHSRKDVVQKVREFKNATPPAYMVSPVLTTGWDFPMDECRFQIIGKISYPDTRDLILKARCETDPEYAPYIAAQQLIQACGRANRSIDDFSENFIIDDNIGWFLSRYSKFAPRWFTEAYRKVLTIPRAPNIISKV